MRKLFIFLLLLVVALTGCSRDGGKNVGARRAAPDTVSATLTNTANPEGLNLNWASRVPDASATLTGLQTLTFVLDGDEKVGDASLNSIELSFTGQSSGKSITISNGGLGKVSNIWNSDDGYLKVEGNTFSFYPHYFAVGEKVTIKATFTYKEEDILSKVLSSETGEGFFSFTVGEDTGEKFSGGVSSILDSVTDSITSGSSSGSGSSGDSLAVRYLVNNASANAEGTVYSTKIEAEKHPILVQGTQLDLALFTRELTGHNITKVYVVPAGKEEELQKLAWQNDYQADGAHMFRLDMSAYPVVTLHIELLDGEEWNPIPRHYYGFLAFEFTP